VPFVSECLRTSVLMSSIGWLFFIENLPLDKSF
jgi:hypothetical protein